MSRDNYLVSSDWLASHLDAPDLVLIDGSYYLPGIERDAYAEYREAHIPGAVFFDINEIADPDTDLPHMLPRPEMFSSRMRKMGIGDGQKIVVYDGAGMFSAARVWWTFILFGAEDVRVLDGGLPKWIGEGRPLDDELPRRVERHFTARRQAGLVYDVDDIVAAIDKPIPIVDARSAGRFAGTEPEPRAGLRSGHIPGSLNLPYDRLLTASGQFKSDQDLAEIFASAGLDPAAPFVASCGSGVTAAIISLASAILTGKPAAVYDGSWTEWGASNDLPIETG